MTARKYLLDCKASLFFAASLCAQRERDDPRFYLCGVHCEPHPAGGVLLVATDNHRLICVHDADGTCLKPITVLLDKPLLAACGKTRSANPRLKVGLKGDAVLDEGAIERKQDSCSVEAIYPDWRRCVAQAKFEGATASYNARYVASMRGIGAALGQTESPSLRIVGGDGKGGAALVLWPHFPGAFALLMPMRADVGDRIPKSLDPVLDPARRRWAQEARRAKRKAAAKARA